MEAASRSIAILWKGVQGHKCFLKKEGDEWVITLEAHGKPVSCFAVEGPGEALRLSEELLRTVKATG